MPLPVLKKEKNPVDVIAFQGFPHGLNTNIPSFQLIKSELARCVNWEINKGGQLQTRYPIVQYTNTATTSNASVVAFAEIPIGGTNRKLLADANNVIYYLDGNLDPVTITGTLEGTPTFIGYNGVAVILDGGRIKYLDGVSTVKIAYDDGTGTSGYQCNNKDADDSSSIALGNGTNTTVAYKFTSQVWTTGYTIPPTTVTAKLSKNGTPAANVISVVVRKVSDGSAIATKTLLASAATLTTVATEYTVDYAASDISSQLVPNTAYYMSVEHTGGDAANYVKVHCTSVGSGGTAFYYAGGIWNADTTRTPNISLRPGMPPKASFGGVFRGRLFVAGDSSNPGYVWFCNLTHLDWSTANGGGYIGAIDASANNFNVGAIQVLYDNLYVFGKETQPYIARLAYFDPSAYELSPFFIAGWATHKTCVNTVNDLFFGAGEGVGNLSGVQEFGDIRALAVSDPIYDRIRTHWNTSTAMAGYYPKDGQYWMVMPTYHRVLVCHTKLPIAEPLNERILRYPWAEYEFYRNILTTSTYKWTASGSGTNEYYVQTAAGGDPGFLAQPDFITLENIKIDEGTAGSLGDHEWDYGDNDTLGYNTVYVRDNSGDPDSSGVAIRSILVPTSLGTVGSDIYIGGSDGFVYVPTTGDYKDLEEYQIIPRLKTSYVEVPFKHVNLTGFQLLTHSRTGAGMSIKLFKNGMQSEYVTNWTINLSADDDLTLAEVTMDLEDAEFALNPNQTPLWKRCNVIARSFQFELETATVTSFPIYINGMFVKFRHLSL
uniref:Uncharacterized protein n=1 Tax=viral metagenome TaxID=1070528 RepID=A0A6M3K193_9ZZZZ